jgi:hypothetical protein|nr:MAG TPA: Lower collar protein [Caudoviricetes sp.]
MSKYTTEVRFICESKSGLSESKGFGSVDDVLNGSWDKIFTSKVSFFDEEYRGVLCKKILKHYYLREIGCETVGIWLLWMNTKLEEIMPYYNKLYESELIKFNPMYDVDWCRKGNKTGNESGSGSRSTSGNNTGTNTQSGTSSNTRKDLYSDTPQGALTGVESETYLTNARKVSDSGETGVNGSTSGSYEDSESSSNKVDTTEDYVESVSGKQGGSSYSKLLNEFRETFLNIDMQVIEEFEEMFMGMW